MDKVYSKQAVHYTGSFLNNDIINTFYTGVRFVGKRTGL